jgi:hypothetical protein
MQNQTKKALKYKLQRLLDILIFQRFDVKMSEAFPLVSCVRPSLMPWLMQTTLIHLSPTNKLESWKLHFLWK